MSDGAPPIAPRERGAALLTTLLLVALLAFVTMMTLDRVALSARLAGNAGHMIQAQAMVRASGALALSKLQAVAPDRPAPPGIFDQAMPFAMTDLGLDGTIVMTPRDGGNCFNLNSLVQKQGVTLVARVEGHRQFMRLMLSLGIDQNSAQQMADGMTDWVDTDGMARERGAEDAEYQRGPSRQLPPNQLAVNPSELRAVAGVTPETYRRLRPYICALPIAELSPINVNSLRPDQAVLLAMLTIDGDIERARSAVAQRPVYGFTNAAQIAPHLAAHGVNVPGAARAQMGIAPQWISLHSIATIGSTPVQAIQLIDNRTRPAMIAATMWGEP